MTAVAAGSGLYATVSLYSRHAPKPVLRTEKALHCLFAGDLHSTLHSSTVLMPPMRLNADCSIWNGTAPRTPWTEHWGVWRSRIGEARVRETRAERAASFMLDWVDGGLLEGMNGFDVLIW